MPLISQSRLVFDCKDPRQEKFFPRTIFGDFVQITNFLVYLSGFVRPAWFIHTTHALFGQEGNVSTVFFGKYNKDHQSEPAKVNFLLRLPVWLC